MRRRRSARVTPEQVRHPAQPASDARTCAAPPKLLARGRRRLAGRRHRRRRLPIPTRPSAAPRPAKRSCSRAPTTSPDDLHGMIAARAVITEQGGSTSHAAVVGRALGLPCVVGCGPGSLAALARQDGHRRWARGQGLSTARCAIEAPDESDDELLATAHAMGGGARPLHVVPPPARRSSRRRRPQRRRAAADPARIGEVLARFKGARGARAAAPSLPTKACAPRSRPASNSSSPIRSCRRCSPPCARRAPRRC